MAIVLFDGVCNLCNGVVRFLVARDRHARLQFAPLTSQTASRALGDDRAALPDSLVVLDGGRILTRSDAALRIARLLGFPWALAGLLLLVPRPVRDWLYDALARRRYSWFGRRDSCMLPGPEVRGRFLD